MLHVRVVILYSSENEPVAVPIHGSHTSILYMDPMHSACSRES